MTKILIVDDNKTTTKTLCTLIEHWGYQAFPAFDGEEALKILESQAIDILFADLKMPKMDGMELLKISRERWPEIIVIVVTAYGTIKTAVDAMKLGAFDFLTKPYENKELQLKFEKAIVQREMAQQLERINARIASFESEDDQKNEMIGNSRVMQRVFQDIRKVAPTSSTVLILGESGTGKELAARAIHFQSPRKNNPFIKIHCAAYAEGLLESELFGHERGAFTGAISRKIGRFEQADKGTLFLDEIGDISPSIQIKLLRFLQEREFERVGGIKTLNVDIRIIAATNRDLTAAIQQNAFRKDLFYRLNVFSITLPSLRERKEDIPALIQTFCQREKKRLNRTVLPPTDQALEAMMTYNWPGNIRELQNVIERAAILADGERIDLEHLPITMRSRPFTKESIPLPEQEIHFDQEIENFEKRLILQAFEQSGYIKAKTAKMLGIDRNRLRYKLKQYGIDD